MSAVGTYGDAVQWYMTGAPWAGVVQRDPWESLGWHRSGSRADVLSVRRLNPIRGLRIDYASGANGPGLGAFTATDIDKLTWCAPGDTVGAAVTIASGETLQISSTDPDAYIIVTRTESLGLMGSETVQLLDTFNNVVGGTNFSGDEGASGEEKYRAVYGLFPAGVTDIWFWLDAANTAVLRFATETPAGDGSITDKRTAGEESQPAGLTWRNPTTEGTAYHAGALGAGAGLGLWIENSVAASSSAAAHQSGIIRYGFTAAAVTYYGALRGLRRTAENNIALFELYHGVDSEPPISGAPYQTSATLPIVTAALSVSHTHYFRLVKRNQYDIVGTYASTAAIPVAADASEDYTPPLGPSVIQALPAAAAAVRVQAGYQASREPNIADRATKFLVYLAANASIDFENDDPVAVVDMGVSAATVIWEGESVDIGARADTAAMNILDWTSDADVWLEGVPVQVGIRTRRVETETEIVDDEPVYTYVNVDSENTDVTSAETVIVGPVAPGISAVTLGRAYGQAVTQDAPADVITLWSLPTPNVYTKAGPGYVQFWSDTTLIWVLWSAGDSGRIGFWTTFSLQIGDVTGAGTALPIEPIGSPVCTEIYIGVADGVLSSDVGVRRMKIDVANKIITVAALDMVTAMTTTNSDTEFYRRFEHTCFQVYDTETGTWVTRGELGLDGHLRTNGAWAMVATEAECL